MGYYRPRTSNDGKVVFSVISVCPQGGGGRVLSNDAPGSYPIVGGWMDVDEWIYVCFEQ